MPYDHAEYVGPSLLLKGKRACVAEYAPTKDLPLSSRLVHAKWIGMLDEGMKPGWELYPAEFFKILIPVKV